MEAERPGERGMLNPISTAEDRSRQAERLRQLAARSFAPGAGPVPPQKPLGPPKPLAGLPPLKLLVVWLAVWLAGFGLGSSLGAAGEAWLITQAIPGDELATFCDEHFGYKADYQAKCCAWAVEHITAACLKHSGAVRRNRFDEDLAVPAIFRGRHSDFTGSGFQQGHCAPADDFPFSQRAMDATFVISNVMPQYPRVNMGPIKAIETFARGLVDANTDFLAITGPSYVADDGKLEIRTIGDDRMFVGNYCWKVVCTVEANFTRQFKPLALYPWLVPNRPDVAGDEKQFRVPLEAVRKASGRDLFARIAPDELAHLEKQAAPRP